MSKMGLHDPFGYLQHKLWPKERPGIKLSIWLLTTKSRESPWFTCVHVACHIPLKNSRQGLKLLCGSHFNQRFAKEVMGLQSCENPNFGNSRTANLGVLGQNDIWVQALQLSTKNTIRGEVMVSPKSGPWWILWGFPQVKEIIGFHEVHRPKQLQVPRGWRKFKPIKWFI